MRYCANCDSEIYDDDDDVLGEPSEAMSPQQRVWGQKLFIEALRQTYLGKFE